ncbi:hypothetical protein BDA96_02G381000 [Sorghum bicolor]|uniref:Uncharacterized protein n=2 Tax=Sorghum bicolor TaxID=4558 RepID=A0A921RTY2_SORBI|nr:hypothetical protein BDA96_02G381000 [Sorghum bicolor]OQU90199.1 hypothetical protein SORBI_3002G363466 [Sorghum bicolor]
MFSSHPQLKSSYCLLIQLHLHARTYGRRVTLICTHQPTKFVLKFCSESAGQKPVPSVEFICSRTCDTVTGMCLLQSLLLYEFLARL